jgi:hypothetical protein
MCGRVRLSSDLREIKIAFGIPPERPPPNFAPCASERRNAQAEMQDARRVPVGLVETVSAAAQKDPIAKFFLHLNLRSGTFRA